MRPSIDTLLTDFVFPLQAAELVDAVGDDIILYPTGAEETVEDVCTRLDVDEFETRDEASSLLTSVLAADAVGRRRYSDRDPPIQGIDRYDRLSC